MIEIDTWASRLGWTVGTLATSWGIGHLLGAVLISRVPLWLTGREKRLTDSALQILRKRLPWWSLLLGAWVAAGYWPLTTDGHLLVWRTAFALGAASVTLALAALGVGGLAVALALHKPLANFFARGREVMVEVAGGMPEFEPFTRYHTFSDSTINFTVILRAKEFVDQYLIKHEFVKRLHTRFSNEGIDIPFPIRSIAYRDWLSLEARR